MKPTLTQLPFDRQAKTAFFVACMVMLLSNVGFLWAVSKLNVFLRKEPVNLRGSFATIPRSLGNWKAIGEDPILDVAVLEELGTNKVFNRMYVSDAAKSTPALNVQLAYYTGMIDAVPHVPDRCMAAGGYTIRVQPANDPLEVDRTGWEADDRFADSPDGITHLVVHRRDDFTGQLVRIPMPTGDFELRTTEFFEPRRPKIRVFSGYFFVANNRITASPEGVKLMAFRPSEKYAYYCKVQFSCGAPDLTREKFLSISSDLLNQLLPELMKRLPDWADVQRPLPPPPAPPPPAEVIPSTSS